VLYTDGVTEAVNLQNQEFGRERLIKLSQEMKNESRRLGKFKDTEFAFQTSWDDDGEQASTVVHEPRENPSRCWH
jgi:serine phosphatase RsbU (regulator of sigma subunit)